MSATRTRALTAGLLLAALPGCFSTPERNPVPIELTNQAAIPGLPGARMWADELPEFQSQRLLAMSKEELKGFFKDIYGAPHNYLAISGGGANGAYGAGLLVGWTAKGTRPEFTMVTGISTGALTAPFAFLGSDYDDELEEVYTTIRTEDLVKERGLLSGLFSDSLTDTAPLRGMIERTFPESVIEAIATQHSRGRRLFVGTMNLDAGRPVIWSIGEIATSGHPGKVSLIHDILQASAAIPVAFPPVMIDVEAEGQPYDEMHVDGGTGSQVFVYPAWWDWREMMQRLEVPGAPQVYVVRNAFLEPDHQGVNRTLLPIASRSIDALIRTQGIGDLYQIYALCERDGNDLHMTWIPGTFDMEPTEGFDPVYMSALFDLGYENALNGDPWRSDPPGLAFEDA
jgi:hypothetical protein